MTDFFRPSHEPALTIYDAFQTEAKNRKEREASEWIKAEREAVWRTARDYAQQHGLAVPTMAQIEQAEASASGHVDYGAKWAYGVAEVLAQKGGA